MTDREKKVKRSLRRRARRFLDTDLYGRGEVRDFCDKASQIGDLAIFGGMLRDLLLEGNEGFCSDIDLVIDTDDIPSLQHFVTLYPVQRTAFGGYRVALKRWVVDLWPLQWTWAIRHGHVKANALADLTKTTFFNWDAIVYELRSGTVHCSPEHIQELHDRLLTINLAENPNPEGVAIRALRMAVTKQARLSFSLAEYIADVLATTGVDRLLDLERQRHRTPRVSASIVFAFVETFMESKSLGSREPIILSERQCELTFGCPQYYARPLMD